jgi:hypothetical protein
MQSPSLSLVKGMSACTVKIIHNHERRYRTADEFEPQQRVRNDPALKRTRSQPLGLGDVRAGTVHASMPGERCPLHLICVGPILVPRRSDITISQIAEMVGIPRPEPQRRETMSVSALQQLVWFLPRNVRYRTLETVELPVTSGAPGLRFAFKFG